MRVKLVLRWLKFASATLAPLCFLISLVFADFALADSQPSQQRFGRYSLIKSLDVSLCLNIGKQIANYKIVSLPKSYRTIPNEPSKLNTTPVDYRCDLPLMNTDSIILPKWKQFDIFSSAKSHGLYLRMYYDLEMRRFLDYKPEITMQDKRDIVVLAKNGLVENLIAAGLLRVENALVKLKDQTEIEAFRLSGPSVPGADIPQCWSLAFPPESTLEKMKMFKFPIRNIFQFKGGTYFLVNGADSIFVTDTKDFIEMSEQSVSGFYQTDRSSCEFKKF
jgi:hypothetical protein